MKDGTTHLAYKAEHAVDLHPEAIVAATVTPADRGDSHTGPDPFRYPRRHAGQLRSSD